MSEGTVVSIQIAPEAAAPMQVVARVFAVPGKGLQGDRYFSAEGTYSKFPGSGREVTLIEQEAFDALIRDYQINIHPHDARRNIVTRGIALNHLVGHQFMVGNVTLRGMRLCEPCMHLEQLTHKGVMKGLIHRGGLRAEIVSEGTINVGDPIRLRTQ